MRAAAIFGARTPTTRSGYTRTRTVFGRHLVCRRASPPERRCVRTTITPYPFPASIVRRRRTVSVVVVYSADRRLQYFFFPFLLPPRPSAALLLLHCSSSTDTTVDRFLSAHVHIHIRVWASVHIMYIYICDSARAHAHTHSTHGTLTQTCAVCATVCPIEYCEIMRVCARRGYGP